MAQANFIKFFNDRGEDANFVSSQGSGQLRASAQLQVNLTGAPDTVFLIISVEDSVYGFIQIGGYGIQENDTSTTIAAGIAASINSIDYGYNYSATSYSNVVTVYAPSSYGSDMVGMNLKITID